MSDKPESREDEQEARKGLGKEYNEQLVKRGETLLRPKLPQRVEGGTQKPAIREQ